MARIETQLEALAAMPIDALRDKWRASVGSEPPHIAANLLRRMLGHALQEKALGGLRPAQFHALQRLAAGRSDKTLRTGMHLIRQWNGRTIVVTVGDNGFVWEDRSYRSLSAIAREVTGTPWSGPRFFGLRDNG